MKGLTTVSAKGGLVDGFGGGVSSWGGLVDAMASDESLIVDGGERKLPAPEAMRHSEEGHGARENL